MEMKMSYLRGFSAEDYYFAAGIYRGSLPGGFVVSALFREPGNLSVNELNYLGNMEDTGGGVLNGWALVVQRGITQLDLQLRYGDSVGTPVTVTGTIINSPVSLRTMLATWFFGIDSGGKNPIILLFINGSLVHLGEDGADPEVEITNGYTPAGVLNEFSLGNVPAIAGSGSAAALGTGMAGVAFRDSAPTGVDLEAALVAASDIAVSQWEGVQAAEDLVDSAGADFDSIFSVRRGLPNPATTWDATLGAETLERQGSASLLVEAAKPRFWSGPWTPPNAVP
jgi:hypothetical protein